MDAIGADKQEYDLFGPWIDEVRGPQDVPRLFRGHAVDLDGARLVLKVPRDIARRDATPGMDLYDHLLVLDADRLTILTRRADQGGSRAPAQRPGAYDEQEIPVGDVVAIRDTVQLLKGTLTIHTRTTPPVHLRFNGAGRAQIRRLVAELTETAAAPRTGVGAAVAALSPARPGPPSPADLPRDLDLISDFSEAARARAGLTAWAWHGRRDVAPRGAGAVGLARRAWHALGPLTLQGAVLARTPSTLEVFTRHDWLVRRSNPVHSSSHIVLPLALLDSVEVAPHPRWAGVDVVRLRGGTRSVDLLVPDHSPARGVLAMADPQALAT